MVSWYSASENISPQNKVVVSISVLHKTLTFDSTSRELEFLKLISRKKMVSQKDERVIKSKHIKDEPSKEALVT